MYLAWFNFNISFLNQGLSEYQRLPEYPVCSLLTNENILIISSDSCTFIIFNIRAIYSVFHV